MRRGQRVRFMVLPSFLLARLSASALLIRYSEKEEVEEASFVLSLVFLILF